MNKDKYLLSEEQEAKATEFAEHMDIDINIARGLYVMQNLKNTPQIKIDFGGGGGDLGERCLFLATLLYYFRGEAI